jgi:hypothetical protein
MLYGESKLYHLITMTREICALVDIDIDVEISSAPSSPLMLLWTTTFWSPRLVPLNVAIDSFRPELR